MADRTRLAIIGYGKIAADQHVPAIERSDRFTLAAIVDPRGGIDTVPCFGDLEGLLASGLAIDAVAICTPPQVRFAVARAAIAAGLHVLLEKPPAATLGAFDLLATQARAAGVTLFAAWHLRFAPMAGQARDWLATRRVARGRIVWREDVRRWHPGQAWLWAPGGLGVFDPGINALSLLTAILPDARVTVNAAVFDMPENAHSPIAAQLSIGVDGAPVAADFDFLQTGMQTWDIELEATDGGTLALRAGATGLEIDGYPVQTAPEREYPGLYAHFADLIAGGDSDADATPLRLVADALLIAEFRRVAAFVD